METWKKIPSWFNLGNYRELINFSAADWSLEICYRVCMKNIFLNIDEMFTSHPHLRREEEENLLKFFQELKERPLFSMHDCNRDAEESFEIKKTNEYRHKLNNVKELSEYQAYRFLIESDKKSEIEKDLDLISIPALPEYVGSAVNGSLNIREKYSHPIANLAKFDGLRFLQISLDASDEQILNEFREWLSDTRNSSQKFIKRQLSRNDFQDWIEFRLLPYWDLATIAAFENATIPHHILGKALFPDEYDVDSAERIRKSVKKKCDHIFSVEIQGALFAQAESEKVQRNILLKK